MKRKILSSLMGVAMLGAAAGANAFIFNGANYDLNGAAMSIMNLDAGSPGFDILIDLSTPYGTSSITSDLGGMAAGGSVSVPGIHVNGSVGLDNPYTQVMDFIRTYNENAFVGSMTTTLNTLVGVASLPGVLNTATAPSFSGTMTVNYNGTFNDYPLLQISGAGAGDLGIAFAFNAASDILSMHVTENAISGWAGLEAKLKNLDGFLGGPIDNTVSAIAYAGQTVSASGTQIPGTGQIVPAQFLQSSQGNLEVTASVPEPASLALLGLGLAGLGMMRRRKA